MANNVKRPTRVSTRVLGAVLLSGVCGMTLAAVSPPERLNIQGVLRDSSGAPVDGVERMFFGIYDTDGGGCPATTGNLLLLDDQEVEVRGGLFNATLGGGSLLPPQVSLGDVLRDHAEVWVEFVVARSPLEVLCPRVRLESAAYALHAGGLTTLDDVAIGTTDPSARLDVVGDAEINGNLSVSGKIDLGPGVDDELTAADVETLTGGGNADANHTHSVSTPPECPAGTTRIAAWCIDILQRSVQNFSNAVSTCAGTSPPSRICPIEALMTCDVLNASSSDCSIDTDTPSTRLWTSTFDAALDTRIFMGIAIYGGDDIVRAGNAGDSHPYYCCLE